MDRQRNLPLGQAGLEVGQGTGVEAKLGGDVHLEPGRAPVGLLALERLPENLIGDRRMTLGMAGNTQALDADVAEHTAVEQIESTCERTARRRQIARDQQRLLDTTRDEGEQSLAQSLRIDDATRDDVRR